MPRIKRLRTPQVTAIAITGWLAAAGSAAADTTPQPGSTTTKQCRFVVKVSPARTSCQTRTVVISGPRCHDTGDRTFLVWDYLESFRAVDYAGNVVVGTPVDGYYSEVRPYAKVIADSGEQVYVGTQIIAANC